MSANVDINAKLQLKRALKELFTRLNQTIIYVTHDQTEAMTLADRIAVLNAGHLQQVGTPAELYDDPANRFVAGFIGSPAMSFLERLDPDAVVGVRPHEVRLGPDIVPAQGGVHPCTIEVVETLGFESFVHLRIGDETLVARVEGPPPSRGPADVQLGQVYRFDPESGDRIR